MLRIDTDRLVLRPHIQEDSESHYRLWSDADNLYYVQDMLIANPQDSRRDLMQCIMWAGQSPREKLFLAVTRREDGAYLGSVGYITLSFTPMGKLADIGWFLLPEHQHQGYATEALWALMRYAFTQDDVARLSAVCYAENSPSERVMQRCGMIKEAHLIKAAWHDGRLKDRLTYRLLKEEWERISI